MKQPSIETIASSRVRQDFANLVERVRTQRTRVIVQKSGVPVAAIISLDDLERLDRIDSDRLRRFAFLQTMRIPFADISPEEIDRELNLALEEVRAEMRSEGEQNGVHDR